jgi:hypothetical protein
VSVQIELISAEQAWKFFDDAAQRELGISGSDFAERWDRGDFREKSSTAVMRVAMLRPRDD